MKRILTALIFGIFVLSGLTKAQTSYDYSSLKAVLVVGQIEDETASAIKSMDKIADFLEIKGVKIFRFYDDKADWDSIKTASKDANFFIYSGHGSNLGEGGKTGGLILKTDISSKDIVQDLKLNSNSIILFKSVCGGAGSSAGDNRDIGINVAEYRVSNYSKPFFDVGASCYYAINSGDGCLTFLKNFFAEKTVQECFDISAKWYKIEISKKYKYGNSKQICIASYEPEGFSTLTSYDIKILKVGSKISTDTIKTIKKVPSYKNYSIAYVANPNFSIKNMLSYQIKK